MDAVQMQAMLSKSPLFSGAALPPEKATVKKFSAGQIISDHLGSAAAVGLVVSGRVAVYAMALDGKDVQLSTLPPGECFGICNLYAESELETVLCCAVATEILYFPKDAVLECMEKDPALAVKYAGLCNQKIQFLLQRIALLTMQSCRGRVIAYLLTQKDEKSQVVSMGSREDLARSLGVSRASLFRELALLQERGVLKTEGNVHTVLDQSKLENLLYYPYP